MYLSKECHGAITLLRIRGSILGDDRKRLAEAIQVAVQDGSQYVILDMAGVDLLDSVGLGTLLACHTDLIRRGKALRICQVQPAVRHLLTLTNLDRVLEIDASEQEAFAASQ